MFGASKTPLAWKSFTHQKLAMFGAVGGVAFAVVLMFLEMGFLNGMFDSQTFVVEQFDADLVITNVDKAAVIPKLPFDRRHLHTARAIPGVRSVSPLRVEELRAMYKNLSTGVDYPMFVYGCDPDMPPFRAPGVAANVPLLKKLDTCLIDERSKPFFGEYAPGVDVEIGGRRLHVVGLFAIGPDFRADGNALVSERTFIDMFGEPELVEFGLVKLAPGADRERVQKELKEHLPPAVAVLSIDELCSRIRHYWGQSKPVGFVFGLGLAVGFLIGMTICYQILYVDITNHLPQYATLKAIGYGNDYLLKIVLKQATYLGIMGFGTGCLVSRAAYAAVEAYTQVPMFFTPARVGLVFVLTMVMCLVSGFIAIGKALDLDPAEVF